MCLIVRTQANSPTGWYAMNNHPIIFFFALAAEVMTYTSLQLYEYTQHKVFRCTTLPLIRFSLSKCFPLKVASKHGFQATSQNVNTGNWLYIYITNTRPTHPDSSNQLHGSHITLGLEVGVPLKVLCSYCDRNYCACSSCRVPSKVLQLAVATAILRYIRPT